MSSEPINAADWLCVILLIFAAIFLYTGYVNSHTGYIILGIFEIILSMLQYYLHRVEVNF